MLLGWLIGVYHTGNFGVMEILLCAPGVRAAGQQVREHGDVLYQQHRQHVLHVAGTPGTRHHPPHKVEVHAQLHVPAGQGRKGQGRREMQDEIASIAELDLLLTLGVPVAALISLGQLGFNPDDIRGETLTEKAAELIDMARRMRKVARFRAEVIKARPEFSKAALASIK
mgnify:CR=1 FL=1